MNHVTCQRCGTPAPTNAAMYSGGPIRWLWRIHYPMAHPEAARSALDALLKDIREAS